MSKIIYIYVLDTMADWEIGNILQSLTLQNMSEKINKNYLVKTVSHKKTPIKTIGGLTIIPECTLAEIDDKQIIALLLPGAETWKNVENRVILEKAKFYLDNDVIVGAICGATLALANSGLLNNYKHTSNSLDYLTMFSKTYAGAKNYHQEKALIDRNLITASSAGSLLWAKLILESLDLYTPEIILSWYNYFLTGEPKFYNELNYLIMKWVLIKTDSTNAKWFKMYYLTNEFYMIFLTVVLNHSTLILPRYELNFL